jgi:putative oxidoreductase
MKTVLGRLSAQTFALFRFVFGLLFFFHGTQKILGWPAMQGMGGGKLPTIPMVAGIIELVCGFLIIIGFFTGLAAFIASGEMAVAYFMAHQPHGLDPLSNKGESAVLYCFAFLFIATHGAGIWSVDNAMGGPRTTSSTGAART